MALITMPNGEKRPYDPRNYRDVAREYIQMNQDRGRDIDAAATLQAFKANAGEETDAFVYTPGVGAVPKIPDSVARVLGNPFVKASEAISANVGRLVDSAKDAAAGFAHAGKLWGIAAVVATVGAAGIAGWYLLRKK